MQELMEILYHDKDISNCLKLTELTSSSFDIEQTELRKRTAYLTYGFGVRTRQVMEMVYPRTKKRMSQAEWNYFGSKYTTEVSPKYTNLNECTLDFPGFLSNNCSNPELIETATIEKIFFLSSSKFVGNPTNLVTLKGLNPETILVLVPHVYIHRSQFDLADDIWKSRKNEMTYLIFRDDSLIRTVSIDGDSETFYNHFKIPNSLISIFDNNMDQGKFQECLFYCMQYGLLSFNSTPTD